MPLTVSHAAAVLPLQGLGRHKLPLSALMIGSMAPDFGYFFAHDFSRQITHSFSGLILFSLPAGLIVWLFYVLVLEKTTITLLPDRWHTRFAHTESITPSLFARAGIAIVLGAFTHILWDAFTHRSTFITDALPALRGPTPGFGWLPVYHLLHGLSSLAGVVLLALWAKNLHRQPARSLIRPYDVSAQARARAVWFITAVTLVVGLLHWQPNMFGRYDAQLFSAAVGLMSGFFIAWCAVAIAWWVRAFRRNPESARR